MLKLRLVDHLQEVKKRLLYILFCVTLASIFSYCFIDQIYLFITKPLARLVDGSHKVIYTGLAEVFFSYIRLSIFVGCVISLPYISYHIYQFISPGLLPDERYVLLPLMIFSPLLFYFGLIFVFYVVMPQAWEFFLGFEINNGLVPLILEARISEYIAIVLQLMIAFGLAFQMPIILVILTILGVFDSKILIRNKRYAIVTIFIIAGVITPPDIISQIALAIPMILLYEISIVLCRIIDKDMNHVGHKMD